MLVSHPAGVGFDPGQFDDDEMREERRATEADFPFTPLPRLSACPLASASVLLGQDCPTKTPPVPQAASSFYSLPDAVRVIYAQRGIRQLYPWQDEVLRREDVCAGRNFVYSLPTSGGKTMVAEILSMRTVLNAKKCAFFVLPYVAVAEEKLNSIRPFAEMLGFGAEGYFGTAGRFPPPPGPNILVCTTEKANSILNHLIETDRCGELGSIVVDELHMVGEGKRGATLEVLLTKWRSAAPQAQVVGMSATIPNLDQIAAWLGASFYVGDFRPVPLVEHVVSDTADIVDDQITRNLPTRTDKETLFHLVFECAPQNNVLVFCPSRQQCIDIARFLASTVDKRQHDFRQKQGCMQTLADLKSLDHYEAILAETIPMGVAYHHGGLLTEEREVIERGFRNRFISVVCCTSTLAAGVNLPARRVIVKSPYVGRETLSKAMYLQMCGRAGRAGLDTFGESFLMLSARERHLGQLLKRKGLDPVVSQMATFDQGRGYARTLLELISIRVCKTKDQVKQFTESLLYARTSAESLDITDALQQLRSSALIEVKDDDSVLPTAFGLASVRSCFSIEEAEFIRQELLLVQSQGLVLSDDLHVCYLLTPVQDVFDCDWSVFQRIMARFDAVRQRIAERVGVDESAVDQLASGLAQSSDRQRLFTLRRFFASMVLSDLLNEVAIHEVEQRYRVSRGQIQMLMKTAAMYSSSICSFCSSMEWHSLAAVLESFVKRLGYGVRPDLVPLMEIKGVTAARARALWTAGFKTAKQITQSTPEELKEAVKKKNPDSRSARYFSIKAAAAVVREAHRLIFAQVKDKQNEILELSVRTTTSTPAQLHS